MIQMGVPDVNVATVLWTAQSTACVSIHGSPRSGLQGAGAVLFSQAITLAVLRKEPVLERTSLSSAFWRLLGGKEEALLQFSRTDSGFLFHSFRQEPTEGFPPVVRGGSVEDRSTQGDITQLLVLGNSCTETTSQATVIAQTPGQLFHL